MTEQSRQRREGVIALAAGGLAAVAIVAAALAATPQSPTGSTSGPPSPASSASSDASPRPSSSPTGGAAADDDEPASVDPYYGDVVVSAPIGTNPGEFSNGLDVELVSVSEEAFTGSGIGTTSGQAVVVELLLTNDTTEHQSVSPTVTAYAGPDRTPLAPVNGGDTDEPFSGSIAASSSQTATYRFVLDPDDSPLWFAVSVGADSGLVVLEYR